MDRLTRFLGSPKSVDERVEELKQEALKAEHRADLIEEAVNARLRIVAAKKREQLARKKVAGLSRGMIMIIMVIGVVLIFLLLRTCK